MPPTSLPARPRLIAATDLSAPARHAVERAARISNEAGGSLEVLHVADLNPLARLRQLVTRDGDELQQRVTEQATPKLEALRQALHQRWQVQAAVRLLFGPLLKLLSEASASAELLVCGARGESFVRRAVLGSTAERMLSASHCPILIVKQAPHASYRNVLVPVDFSAASLRAIQHARLVAPQAELILLHVFELPFEGEMRYASVDDDTMEHYGTVARQRANEQMRALLKQAGLAPEQVRTLIVHGDPPTRIVEQEQEQDCDLLVMGKHGADALLDWLLGSVTKRVLNDCQSDVLVSV